MFSFAIDKGAADTRKTQLASHAITEDRELAHRLRLSGEYDEGEAYYRAENETPKSVEEAIEFVQGICFRAPNRVWIGDDEYEVTQEMTENTDKPTA